MLFTGISVLLLFCLGQAPYGTALWAPLLPLLILGIAAVFLVRGYEISKTVLIIHRLGWSNRYDLSRMVSIRHDPAALKGSIRNFGNGGLLSFSGFFWNKTLGSYRLYATDINNAVLIKLPGRVIVITPDNPDRFMQAAASAAKTGSL